MFSAIDKIQPSASVEIEGVAYPLRFDFDALARAESLTGFDLLANHPARFYRSANAAQVRGLFYAAGHLTDARIPAGALRIILDAIGEAWVLSMPERKPGDKKIRKPQSTREIWESCYSLARVELRFTDRQFGQATPRTLRLLLDRCSDRLEQEKILFGTVAATIANFSQCRPEETILPGDFFGSGRRQKGPDKARLAFQDANIRSLLMSKTTETKKRTDVTQEENESNDS